LVINTVDTADNLTLNVGIASSTTALTKTGAGTLTLTANRDYLFTGATYVNAGTLVLNSLTSAVAGGFRSSVTINNGGTAKLGASNKIIDTAAFTVNAGGTFDLAGFSEAITTLNGSGSVTNSTGTPSTLSWRGTGTSIFSGVISGNTSLFLDNANAYTINLTLSGQNTYTGTTTIGGGGAGGGILTLGANNAVPSGSTIYVGVIGGTSGGAVFDLAGFDQTAGPIYMAAGNTSASYARIVNTAGSSKLTLTGGASALTWTPRGVATDASAIVGVTTVDLNNAPQTFTVGQVSFNTTVGYCLWVSSVITNGSLIKAGTGFLLLTGVNTYTGATTISGGTLEIGVSGVLGGGAYAANITNNATFSYNSTATQTLSGVISGTGALVKNNTGTLNLTGLNTYTNTTTVSAGTLLVNGSLNVTSRVTVASAGTLGGAGTMGIVTNTGTLAVGNGATMGTLTTSNLVMGASSTYVFDLNGTGSGDSVTVNGNLTLNSSSVITVVPQGVFNGGHTYTLFNYKTVSGTLPTTVLGGNPIRAMTLMDDSANNRIVLKVAGPAGTLISFF
jgi:autotransporter-associated beta strand protein